MTGKHIYQILLSALCILLAVLICSAAVGIYREGSRRKAEHPLETVYTKEAVEDVFAHIAPLLIVTAVMAGGGILLRVQDDRKTKSSGGLDLLIPCIKCQVGKTDRTVLGEQVKRLSFYAV